MMRFFLAIAVFALLASYAFGDPVSIIKSSGVIPGASSSYENQVDDENLPVLYGVFVSPKAKKAILYDRKQNKRFVVKEGEEIGGFIVKRISKGEVIIASKDREFVLRPFNEEAAKYRSKFSKAKLAYASYEDKNAPPTPSKRAIRTPRARLRVPARRTGSTSPLVPSRPSSQRKPMPRRTAPLPFAELAQKLKKAGHSDNPFLKLMEILNRNKK